MLVKNSCEAIQLIEKDQFGEGLSQSLYLKTVQELMATVISEEQFEAMERHLQIGQGKTLVVLIGYFPASFLLAHLCLLLALQNRGCNCLIVLKQRLEHIPEEWIEQGLQVLGKDAEDMGH